MCLTSTSSLLSSLSSTHKKFLTDMFSFKLNNYVNYPFPNITMTTPETVENGAVETRSKNKTFWHHSRKYLREYSDVTGIQGLRYVTEKRTRMEKVFWAIILLLSLAGCIYMIREIVMKFKKSPIVITFASHSTPIYEIPFPAVTICPESKCSRKKFSYSDVVLKNPDSLSDKELKTYNCIAALCRDNGSVGIIKATKSLDVDCFEILNTTKPEVRGLNGFTPIISTQGICYTFNMLDRSELFKEQVAFYGNFSKVGHKSNYNGEKGYDYSTSSQAYPRRALMPGVENSKTILIISNSSDNDYICSSFYQGYRVMIHHPFDFPHFILGDHFQIPFDKLVMGAVVPEMITTSEEVRNLNPEQRNCYFMNERPLKYFKFYTQSNCLLDCVTNRTLSKCGCVPFYMPRDNQTLLCGIGSAGCVDRAYVETKSEEFDSKISTGTKETNSQCDCKPLCTSLKYDVVTAHSDIHWRQYLEAVNKTRNMTLKQIHEESAYSVLAIYFKTDQFISVERNLLYGVSDLVSNFGGILGLFTGFSLVTMAEIVYFATIRIFYNRRLYQIWSGQ